MHPQNDLSDLIDEFYQPLKNKTDISLIEILGVIEKEKEAHVGKRKNNNLKYKRQHDRAGQRHPSGS